MAVCLNLCFTGLYMLYYDVKLGMLPTVFEEKAENYFKSMSLRNKMLNRHRNLCEATLMCVLEARHMFSG